MMDIFHGTTDELKTHLALLKHHANVYALLTSEEMAAALEPCDIGRTEVELGGLIITVEWSGSVANITARKS